MEVESRIKREEMVRVYLKEQIKAGKHPTYRELQNKFNLTYFKIDWKKLYLESGISMMKLPVKRPAGCDEILRRELMEYVKGEISKNHYPSRRELESKFRVKIGILFGNIENLYNQSQSKYVQKDNQFLKQQKAKMLLKIVRDVLGKLGLKIVKARRVQEHGVDIIARDNKGDFVGIELKAYNKYEAVKPKNIEQLKNSLKRENIKRGILITTTSKVKKNMDVPDNIRIVLFDEISNLCGTEIKANLDFIRNYSVHIETEEKEAKRKEIITIFREQAKNGKIMSAIDISKRFKIHPYTYFKSIFDIYEKAGIFPSTYVTRGLRDNARRTKLREQLANSILDYIKMEVKRGHYPTSNDIKIKFGIPHIWDYFKMSDLYRKLNLPSYLERGGRYHRG